MAAPWNSISATCFRVCAGRLMFRTLKSDIHHWKPLLHVLPLYLTHLLSLSVLTIKKAGRKTKKTSLINISKVDLPTTLLYNITTHCMSVPDKQVSYIIRDNNEKYAAQWQTQTVVWGEARVCLPSTDQLESDWTPPNHINLQIWQIEKSLIKLYN